MPPSAGTRLSSTRRRTSCARSRAPRSTWSGDSATTKTSSHSWTHASAPLGEPGGALMSMHVDDVRATFDRLIELGARAFDPVTQRGDGWWSASVTDPFGNLIGLIQSPHWAAQHAS
ncbi:VOC family protein [Microbacterium sp.]|uniref:VOC family protein n=1 Tax=Microbacterium sp. TaxID=51671 RepID=UPI0035C66997